MTTAQLLKWIAARGVVLEAARGPVPSVADHIAGEAIAGSWWKHPRAQDIFRLTRELRDADEILVCRLVNDKITFVHRNVWPALVRLADRFPAAGLARVEEVHTAGGKHALRKTPFPKWVPAAVLEEGEGMEEAGAEKMLKMIL